MNLLLVGLNHRTAPVELREKLAYSAAETEAALKAFVKRLPIQEAFLLSTCNRTELFAVYYPNDVTTGQRLEKALVNGLLRHKKVKSADRKSFYTLHEDAAMVHLFRVGAGLESMVVGESQVLSQVKDAYHLAMQAKSCGVVLNRLLPAAIRVGKRSRTETKIGRGAVSVSLAVVEMAKKFLWEHPKPKALVLGAGGMAALIAAHFAKKINGTLLFANRTSARADALAAKYDGCSWPFKGLADALADVDIVFAAVTVADPLITEKMVEAAMQKRPDRKLFVIDIGVPRNVEPEVRRIHHVVLHDIDALRTLVDQNLAARSLEISQVEAIIREELDEFLQWYRFLAVTPTLRQLTEKFERIRKQEIARHIKGFSDKQFAQVDQFSKSLLRKIFKDPIERLRRNPHPGRDETSHWLNAIRHMFNLEPNADG